MAVLKALQPAANGLFRNPILFVITGLYGIVQLPQLLLQSQDPIVAALVSLVFSGILLFVAPFFQGGLLAMGDEAITGTTSLNTLIEAGKTNYVALLLAYLILIAINLVFGMMLFFGILIGGVGLYAGDVQPSLAVIALLVGIGLLFVLAYVLVIFFVQFYAHAIVLSDTGLIDGFKRSIGLVRRRWLSVAGYSILLVIGGAFFGGVGAVATTFFTGEQLLGRTVPDLSLPLLIVALLVFLLSVALIGALYATYSVAFYREIDIDSSMNPK